jgi:hypothetical protein
MRPCLQGTHVPTALDRKVRSHTAPGCANSVKRSTSPADESVTLPTAAASSGRAMSLSWSNSPGHMQERGVSSNTKTQGAGYPKKRGLRSNLPLLLWVGP